MPLPAALLARLAKRGIVKDAKEPEETFAEDYSERDDRDDINPENYEYRSRKRENVWRSKVKQRFKENSLGVKGCPNKWNIWHICTVFCLERWGEGVSKPSKSYRERYLRLLARYPLPKNWIEVWDAGCESFYFWNKTDDFVSWLPPKHPKAVFGKSAASQRSEKERPDMDDLNDEPLMPPPASRSTKSPPPQSDEHRYRPAPAPKKTKSRDLEKILRTKKGRKQFHETSDKLDPMDPAAYSDCGRGKWSSGLNVEGEGKTGVDSTASGQLFQQRPYPSPGDILRANQAGKRKNSDDEEEEGKRRRYSDED